MQEERLVPHVLEIDYVPPVGALLALADLPYPFFLDSGDGGDVHDDARFSILGADPFGIVSASMQEPGCGWLRADPFGTVERLAGAYAVSPAPGLPFAGGLVGYLGYDLRHAVERLPQVSVPDIDLPDMFFGLYDVAAVFDHALGRAHVVSTGLSSQASPTPQRAKQRADWLASLLAGARQDEARPSVEIRGEVSSNFSRAAYLRAVDRARDYIFAGDIYQANLSQRFEVSLDASPAPLYAVLRRLSPAPFGAFLDTGRGAVLSNSPERFLLAAGSRVETRPIKGTRPRGADRESDASSAGELLASEKDAAEHIMIVDLERNDLGRVCEAGTVRVESLKRLCSYENVHHLVSVVSGSLRPETGLAGLLRATFPGGSITGAPKIRAMEIIDELEPSARNVYTGAIGYASFCGRADFNIAIRTLLLSSGRAFFQVGGGIVADSSAKEEYEETMDKAAAFFALLEESAGVRTGP